MSCLFFSEISVILELKAAEQFRKVALNKCTMRKTNDSGQSGKSLFSLRKPINLSISSATRHLIISMKATYKGNRIQATDMQPTNLRNKNSLGELKSSLANQQTVLKMFSEATDITTGVSFVIYWNIAQSKLPHTEGGFYFLAFG